MTIKSASIRTAQVFCAVLYCIALSVPLSSSAVGAPGDRLPAESVAQADRDRDGALTRAEACAGKTPRICKRFPGRLTAIQDGVVTRAEIRAYQQAKRVTRPPVAGGPSR